MLPPSRGASHRVRGHKAGLTVKHQELRLCYQCSCVVLRFVPHSDVHPNLVKYCQQKKGFCRAEDFKVDAKHLNEWGALEM